MLLHHLIHNARKELFEFRRFVVVLPFFRMKTIPCFFPFFPVQNHAGRELLNSITERVGTRHILQTHVLRQRCHVQRRFCFKCFQQRTHFRGECQLTVDVCNEQRLDAVCVARQMPGVVLGIVNTDGEHAAQLVDEGHSLALE